MSCTQFSHLTQHVETNKHKDNIERQQKASTSQQKFISAFSNNEVSDPFVEDLADALIGANIPFFKLENQSFKYFLSKYCNRQIPDESTLRKKYLDICFRRVCLIYLTRFFCNILVN